MKKWAIKKSLYDANDVSVDKHINQHVNFIEFTCKQNINKSIKMRIKTRDYVKIRFRNKFKIF